MQHWAIYLTIGAFFLGSNALSNPKTNALFSSCGDANTHPELNGSLCAELTLPLSYDADLGDISIFIRHYPAPQEAQGNIWFLAGGPGESGAAFLARINFFRDIFPNHNLFIPDHRGTGFSSKLCESEESLESPAGLALAGAEWRSCFASLFENTKRAHEFTRQNAAQDIVTLITKTGPAQETFIYGVSYGTSLALEVGKRAGSVIDGLILDSLTPSPQDAQFGISYHSFNADRIGTALLERCAKTVHCPGGPNLPQDYQVFLANNGDMKISGVALRQYFGSLLDIPHARSLIPAIIDALIKEDKNRQAQLVMQADAHVATYYEGIVKFPQSPSSIPLVALISGSEGDTRPQLTLEDLEEEHRGLGFISAVPQHLVANTLPLYAATPAKQHQSLPPIFVIHGDLDPKTPHQGAIKHVERLEGQSQIQMMTVKDAPHGIFLSSPSCLKGPLQKFIANPETILPTTCVPTETDLDF